MNETEARARVGEVALSFLSTPFHDHGEVKGAGVDCATLIKCVMTEAGIVQPFELDYYSPQHFLHQKEERYIAWVEKCGGREIAKEEAKPGDIVLYHLAHVYAHGAIIIEPGWPHIIHAHSPSRCVRKGNGERPMLGTRVHGMKFFSLFAGESKKKD